MLTRILKKLLGASDRKPVILPVRQQDVSELAEIHKMSFSRGWSDGEFEALLAQNVYSCLVAHDTAITDRSTSGFVLIRTVMDEAEIISVATKPGSRRKGIARQLMSTAIRNLNADRVKTIFLEVDTNNEAAISLYRKLGFVKVSSRQGYYADASGNGDNASTALVMQLELG